jgi:hypothetical protein
LKIFENSNDIDGILGLAMSEPSQKPNQVFMDYLYLSGAQNGLKLTSNIFSVFMSSGYDDFQDEIIFGSSNEILYEP